MGLSDERFIGDETSPFVTLDVSKDDSLLAEFDPLPRHGPPSAPVPTPHAPLTPFTAALTGGSAQIRPVPRSPTRSHTLVGLTTPRRAIATSPSASRAESSSPSKQTFITSLVGIETPTAARKSASPTKSAARHALLSVRAAPKYEIALADTDNTSTVDTRYFESGDTTTMPKFSTDASLIADEGGSFLAEETMTEDFSKILLSERAKQIDATETLPTTWWKTAGAEHLTSLLDETAMTTAKVELTAELRTPAKDCRVFTSITSPSRTPRPAAMAPRLSSPVRRDSPLKGLKSSLGRALVEGRATPARRTVAPKPDATSAVATPSRRAEATSTAMTPRSRASQIVRSKSNGMLLPSTRPAIAPVGAITKSASSTSLAVRSSAVPRPSAVVSGRGPRPSGLPAPRVPSTSTSGLKPFNLPVASALPGHSGALPRRPSVALGTVQSSAALRPLNMQGSIPSTGVPALKRSYNAPAPRPALSTGSRMPRSQSEMTSLASRGHPPVMGGLIKRPRLSQRPDTLPTRRP